MSEQNLQISVKAAIIDSLNRGRTPSFEQVALKLEDASQLTYGDFVVAKEQAERDFYPTVNREASKKNPQLYRDAKAKAIAAGHGRVIFVDD